MNDFRFRLERLRDLRLAEEKETARGLAAAREAVGRAERIVEDLAQAEAQLRERIHDALETSPTAGHMQNLQVVLTQLRRQRAEALAERRHAEALLEESIQRFQDAFREREILDRLRERRREEWARDQLREEQKNLDEVGRGRDDMTAAVMGGQGSS